MNTQRNSQVARQATFLPTFCSTKSMVEAVASWRVIAESLIVDKYYVVVERLLGEPMELQNFIKTSLVEIIQGIDEAKKELKESLNNCPIAPGYVDGVFSATEEKIEFDIAVSSSEEKIGSAGVKGGIKVLSASLSGDLKTESETVSRIKFAVPYYPQAQSKSNA